MKRAVMMFIILLIAAVALTACNAADSPEVAAKEWLQALSNLDGLKLDERTCSAQKQLTQQGGMLYSAFSKIGQDLTGQNVKIDVSEVKVSIASSGDTAAKVQVTGKIRASIGLAVQSQEIADTWKMVKEDGKWKYCGRVVNYLFTTDDLPKLILQPNDMPSGLSNYNPGEGLPPLYQKDYIDQIAPIIQASWAAHAGSSQMSLSSYSILFKDPENASNGFQLFTKFYAQGFSNPNYAFKKDKDIDASGLGDQNIAVSLSVAPLQGGNDIAHEYLYLWRVNNVVSILFVDDMSGQIQVKETDARGLANKIQSYIDAILSQTPQSSLQPVQPTAPQPSNGSSLDDLVGIWEAQPTRPEEQKTLLRFSLEPDGRLKVMNLSNPDGNRASYNQLQSEGQGKFGGTWVALDANGTEVSHGTISLEISQDKQTISGTEKSSDQSEEAKITLIRRGY